MKEVPAHEILEKFFQTIVEEAKTNPAFAKHMLSAFPENLIAKIEQPQSTEPEKQPENQPAKTTGPKENTKAKTGRQADSFDPKAYNPVVLYRNLGEDLMRVRLNKLTAANLKKIDRAFQLKLAKLIDKKSPTKPDLIKALITFAKAYDTQRKGAAG